jgi:hypothetical protein
VTVGELTFNLNVNERENQKLLSKKIYSDYLARISEHNSKRLSNLLLAT